MVKDEDLKGTLGVLLSVSSNEPNRRNLISNDNEGFVENRIKHALRIGLLHRLLAVLFHIVVPGRQACTIDQALARLEKANEQRRIWSIIPGIPTFLMER